MSIRLQDHVGEIADFPKPGILFYDISPLLAHAGVGPRSPESDALMDAGDLEEQRVWLRVIEAIKVLSRVAGPPKWKMQ